VAPLALALALAAPLAHQHSQHCRPLAQQDAAKRPAKTHNLPEKEGTRVRYGGRKPQMTATSETQAFRLTRQKVSQRKVRLLEIGLMCWWFTRSGCLRVREDHTINHYNYI
jgi:hypothetical protein